MKSFLRCKNGAPHDPCDLVRNGTRKRKPKTTGGSRAPLVPVQRYYCKIHGRFVSLTPRPLLPRLHYEAAVVNYCVESRLYRRRSFQRSLPHRKTVLRWVKQLSVSWDQIQKSTKHVLGKTWSHILEGIQRGGFFRLSRLWELLELLAREASDSRSPYFYVLTRSP